MTRYNILSFFFFSSRSRHTSCALVPGVQTCALPIFVDPDRPCPHFAPDSKSRLQIACEAGRLQAELTVIGHHDGFLDRIDLDENHDRAEHLLLDDPRIARNAGNHRRLNQATVSLWLQ